MSLPCLYISQDGWFDCLWVTTRVCSLLTLDGASFWRNSGGEQSHLTKTLHKQYPDDKGNQMKYW